MVGRGDSSAGAAIHRAEEKGKSYLPARAVEIALGKNFKNSNTPKPIADPTPHQAAIFKD